MKQSIRCFVVALALSPALADAHQGSMEDQLACTPDVYRLCSQYVPDEDAIVACLQKNKASLSAACHEVFSRPDTMAPKSGTKPDSDD